MTSKPQIAPEDIFDYLKGLQDRLVCTLGELEDTPFTDDRWIRSEKLLGEGRSVILEEGTIIERGGVNFSHVSGSKLPPAATARKPDLEGHAFEAAGVSLVVHPVNPYAPTAHMNVRFFLVRENDGTVKDRWVGGGMDLTPYYGFDEDCIHFHQACKNALDKIDIGHYPVFKRQCDQYFHLPHRGEQRGIGGIFYDDIGDSSLDGLLALTKSVGDGFSDAYMPILRRRTRHAYGDREREFQLHRRGRYVEFNLLYDRGTLFGLQSGGRIESILMSLPPHARWGYNRQVEPGSPEANLIDHYLTPRNWLMDS